MWSTLMKQSILLILSLRVPFSSATNIALVPNKATTISVNSVDLYTLSLGALTSNATHVIFQAHSQWQGLKLSLDRGGSYALSATGSGVGVLSLLSSGQRQAESYLRLHTQGLHSTIITNITVVVAAWLYHQGDPLPGGCNMELPMDQDPNILLQNHHRQNQVQFQYSNVGLTKQGDPVKNCEDKLSQSELTYHVYQYFMSERDQTEKHFVESITNMMDPDKIPDIARKIKTINYHQDKTELSFGGYRGQGVIYTVLVHEELPGGSRRKAAYVTVHTYSCTEGDCSPGIVDIVFACVFGVCGLFVAFLGHRFFKCMLFLFGHLALFIIFYVLVTRFTTWSETATLVSAFCLALTGGSLWLLLWAFCGFPVLSVLLPGLVFGYVMSSLVFNYTPLGFLKWWSSELNYGMGFACGVLLLPVLILFFTRFLSILSCALVGSYMVFYAMDKAYLRGSVHQIIDISFNKATQPGYIQALATLPIQYTDVILLCAWFVVLIISFVFQWMREKGRPEFPPCPWKEYRYRQQRSQSSVVPVSVDGEDGEDDEEPLLAAHRQLLPSAPPPYSEHPDVVRINGSRDVDPL